MNKRESVGPQAPAGAADQQKSVKLARHLMTRTPKILNRTSL